MWHQSDNMNQSDTGQRFTECWTRAQPLVASYVYGVVRHWHDAEELLQEIAVLAYRAFADFDPSRPFVPWIMTIARNAVIDRLRRAGPNISIFNEQILSTLARVHESFEPLVGPHRAALDHCVRRLTERQRLVLTLRYQDELAVKDIADSMKTTPNAVSILLHKIRAALADCIRTRLLLEDAR